MEQFSKESTGGSNHLILSGMESVSLLKGPRSCVMCLIDHARYMLHKNSFGTFVYVTFKFRSEMNHMGCFLIT